MSALKASEVQQILRTALASAKEQQLAVAIAVVDSAGHLSGFIRSDDVILGPVDVCQRKARTAVLFKCSSAQFGEVIEKEKLLGMELSNGGLAAFGGGLPIVRDGDVIGAIGVSGATAKQDEDIARAAIEGI